MWKASEIRESEFVENPTTNSTNIKAKFTEKKASNLRAAEVNVKV
jgi:hypothetical protein